jgi:Domain of unknown function (DUF4276)
MPRIVSIVEGDGEKEAVPNLLTTLLYSQSMYHYQVQPALTANGVGNLTKEGGIEKFISHAMRMPDCVGILVLLDSDGDCPVTKAKELAKRIQVHGTKYPVAIVLAHNSYEAWLLASIDTVCEHPDLPSGLTFEADCQEIPSPKRWIKERMHYHETTHQLELTRLMDVDIAKVNSRSFRRFCHAVEEILEASVAQTNTVTPQ